ncbi:ankyrin repeat domain-containing protein [Zobellia nedashkovskayae]|uniref:ankyrin repeat domain-containing protein n=1 Tax=Zobellia nedashkovskayae TaxID=2779510 RepID=UPI00188C0733|nr:ankyrin repeat domain-containing protein [Zobellia nedashkovskayae]
MKNNILNTIILVLSFSLVSSGAIAQRNAPRDPNPFLNKDYWEKQPSISTIQSTIKDGHSVTVANRGGFDATTYAIFAKNPVSTVQYLIDQGNDINKRTHDSRTYVFWAASSGDLEMVKHLINKGSKLDLVDSHGYGPISFTAATGQTDTAIYNAFIAGGVDVKNEKDHHGKNALLIAAGKIKDLTIIDYFISKGLELNSTDEHGNGIFNYAAQGGNIDVLKKLVERGVSIKKNEGTGENAILFASRGGRGASNGIEVFKYLESLGLNANVSSKNGVTPLHNLARSSEDIKVFEYLVTKGVDPNAVDNEGNTALLNAAQRNSLKAITFFAEKSKNIDQKDKGGRTALAIAVQNNSADVVSYLISIGADVNVIDEKGNNLAAYLFGTRGKIRDYDAKVAALTEKGFDFKKAQGDKSTVWHLAVAKNDLKLLKKVNAFGADINAKDADGNTPLHYAAMITENAGVLRYLLANGADTASTTEFGETALDLAKENELLVKNKVDLEFLN